MMNAIQVETDGQNTHMLLGGLMLCVQDSAIFEENVEINVEPRQTSPAPSDTNLLSSGMLNGMFLILISVFFFSTNVGFIHYYHTYFSSNDIFVVVNN